jgi:hypothetical protein
LFYPIARARKERFPARCKREKAYILQGWFYAVALRPIGDRHLQDFKLHSLCLCLQRKRLSFASLAGKGMLEEVFEKNAFLVFCGI